MSADDTEGSSDGGPTTVRIPDQTPSTAIETSPVKPPERESERLTVFFPPCATLTVAADNAIAIAGIGSVPSSPVHAVIAAAATTATMDLGTRSSPPPTLPPDLGERPIYLPLIAGQPQPTTDLRQTIPP
jgi:hypothetical protein